MHRPASNVGLESRFPINGGWPSIVSAPTTSLPAASAQFIAAHLDAGGRGQFATIGGSPGWFWLLVVISLVVVTAAVVWRAGHNRRRRAKEKLEERQQAGRALREEQMQRLHAERELRALSQRLLTAHEDDRRRVARELHDDVTQRLARLAIDAAQAERLVTLAPGDETLRAMREELVRLSEDVHSLAYRLHPSVLEELGLIEALRVECDQISRSGALRVDVKWRNIPAEIPPEIALTLFRIAQESLRNVVRHAAASTVEVLLAGVDGGLQLAVHDDGMGFHPGQNGSRPSLGHVGMRERINLVNGELDIESAPGHGTTILAWVPLSGPSNL